MVVTARLNVRPIDRGPVGIALGCGQDDRGPSRGEPPTEMVNIWNSFYPIWWVSSAVQTTLVGALVTVDPDTCTGFGRSVVMTCAVQPSMGLTETEVSGVSVGSFTSSRLVLAVADSLGTMNVSLVNPPSFVTDGSTVT